MLNNSKRWIIAVISIVLTAVIIFGTVTYFIDPLVQYKKDDGRFSYWMSSEIYTNPGIAKNSSYDTVMVGSSMAHNNDVSKWNKKLGCNMIKLTFSGASTYNLSHILDVCFNSKNKIKSVYWIVDETALSSDYKTPRYPLPEYLYDYNRLNDISYLLNLDIAYFYSLKSILYSIKGDTRSLDRGGIWAEDLSVYNKENMLKSFDFPMKENKVKGERYYIKNLTDNLKYNIIPLLKANSETEFNFYFVPYSICYWYKMKCEGTLDAHLYDVKTAIGEILKYDNAKIYFFQNETEIITDLNLYKDFSHYSPKINNYMLDKISKGQNRLFESNYIDVINEFCEYLNSFDYNTFIKKAKANL